MKKFFALLIAIMFASSTTVFAAGATLSDSEMDEIAAGEWVILTDEEGAESVEEVHFNNNDINLEDESQMEIKAVNNANSVDSAVAQQTNISSANGEIEGVNHISGSNAAEISNYNPGEIDSAFNKSSSSYGSKDSLSTTLTLSTIETQAKNKSSKEASDYSSTKASASASSFGLEESSSSSYSSSSASASESWKLLNETNDIEETLDIAYAAAGSSEGKDKKGKSESAFAESLVVDYDYDLDYDKNLNKGDKASSSSSKEKESAYSKDIEKASSSTYSSSKDKSSSSESTYASNKSLTNTSTTNTTQTSEHTKTKSSEGGSFKGSAKSENNHLNLYDTAQTNIQVVSNLNAVGSGAAQQTNIAHSNQVAGSITHSNVASVSNGAIKGIAVYQN